jgi:hypothetical protein
MPAAAAHNELRSRRATRAVKPSNLVGKIFIVCSPFPLRAAAFSWCGILSVMLGRHSPWRLPRDSVSGGCISGDSISGHCISHDSITSGGITSGGIPDGRISRGRYFLMAAAQPDPSRTLRQRLATFQACVDRESPCALCDNHLRF